MVNSSAAFGTEMSERIMVGKTGERVSCLLHDGQKADRKIGAPLYGSGILPRI